MKPSIKTKSKESKSSQPELGKLAIDLLYKLPELFCEMIIPYTCHEVPREPSSAPSWKSGSQGQKMQLLGPKSKGSWPTLSS